MSQAQSPRNQLIDLVEEQYEFGLSIERQAELEVLLTSHPELREVYLQAVQTHVYLEQMAQAPVAPLVFETIAEEPLAEQPSHGMLFRAFAGLDYRVHPARFATFVITATVLVWSAFLAWVLWPSSQGKEVVQASRPKTSTAPAQVVARLVRSHRAHWGPSIGSTSDGAYLLVGQSLILKRGLAAIKFDQGARVVLEGPAKLIVDGENQASLEHGKLVGKVAGATKGFAVQTPWATVVDLGTEFGIQVAQKSSLGSVVRVFDGVVRVSPADASEPRRPAAGQSLRISDAGAAQLSPAEDAEVSLVRDLPAVTPQQRLIGFYPFEGDAQDASGAGNHPVTVSGISFVAGHDGQAAQFAGQPQSFIELPIDVGVEALPRLTWGAWVRPTRLDRSHEILSADDGGFDRTLTIDTRSGPQAIVATDGPRRFALFAGPKLRVLASRGPRPQLQKWTFVAAVYNQPAQTATLYIEDRAARGGRGALVRDHTDGARIGPSAATVRIGRHRQYVEAFAGEIDNVFLIAGALSSAELETIRTTGRAAIERLADVTKKQ